MADVYTQDWAAGNSLFTSVNVYDRGVDGVDPLYPEIENAQDVTIAGGQLDWNGVDGDYQTAGIYMTGFPTFQATEAFIRCTYTPNATSFGDNNNAPLISTFGDGFTTFELTHDTAGSPFLYFRIEGWATVFEFSDPFTFVADTPYEVVLAWKCGTVIGPFSNVLADGYARVYINGVLVYEQLNCDVWIDSTTNNELEEVSFGFMGLFGALDDITFSDSAFSLSVATIPTNGSTPCCAPPSSSPQTSGGGVGVVVPDPGVGATMPSNQYEPLQPWTRSCGTGGLPPSAPDEVDSEAWA